MLKTDSIRGGARRVIGSVTTRYSGTSAVVRDETDRITGRTGDRFHTTRGGHGILISMNSSDPGLPIRGK